MKKMFFAALICTGSIYLHAQTTSNEYNYITQSYKLVEEGGMDVKSGYEVSPVTNFSTAIQYGKDVVNRKARLLAFYRKADRDMGTSRKLAAYIIVYQNNNGQKEYFCVPSPSSSSEIIQTYRDALYDPSRREDYSAKLQVFTVLLSRGLQWN